MLRLRGVLLLILGVLALAGMVAAEPAEMPLVLVADDLRVTNLATDGTYLYATTIDEQLGPALWSMSLRILDASSPTAPAEIGRVAAAASRGGMIVNPPDAFLAWSTVAGTTIIHVDISDPTALVLGYGWSFGGSMGFPHMAFTDDGKTFVATDSTDLLIFPLSDTYTPFFHLDVWDGLIDDLAVVGDVVFATELVYVQDGGWDGLWQLDAVDISNPLEPTMTSTPGVPYEIGPMAVKGNTLYMLDQNAVLHLWDVSAPTSAAPTPAALTNTTIDLDADPLCAVGIDGVNGDYMVARLGDRGLRLLDVSGPTAPAVIATYTPPADKDERFVAAVCIPPYVYAAVAVLLGPDVGQVSTAEAVFDDAGPLVRFRAISAFLDMPLSHWAQAEVWACSHAGIVGGYPDGTYQPSATVTRDQMAVYVARAMAGGDANVPADPMTTSFDDVPVTHWAHQYVEYAISHDVVRGYDDGFYRPAEDVDRGQMAVYVARARGWVAIDDDMTTAPQVFPDVPAAFWAGTAVQACVAHGVVQGYDDGNYYPANIVTRDQMAVYVARAFGL